MDKQVKDILEGKNVGTIIGKGLKEAGRDSKLFNTQRELEGAADTLLSRVEKASKMVYLVTKELGYHVHVAKTDPPVEYIDWSVTFYVYLNTQNDRYLDKVSYDKGEAYVRTSPAFMQDVEKWVTELFGVELRTNNVGSVFMISGYFERPKA